MSYDRGCFYCEGCAVCGGSVIEAFEAGREEEAALAHEYREKYKAYEQQNYVLHDLLEKSETQVDRFCRRYSETHQALRREQTKVDRLAKLLGEARGLVQHYGGIAESDSERMGNLYGAQSVREEVGDICERIDAALSDMEVK